MKFTLLQTDIQWASHEENIRRADALLRSEKDSDVYVLPEMWATGFATEPEGVAEMEESSAALRWMRETAVERHCAVCGSLAVRVADGSYRNRFYFTKEWLGDVEESIDSLFEVNECTAVCDLYNRS